MAADPELASSFAAHVADNALQGFELSAPAVPVAAYISAEQSLGRIRADVDAGEAAAVVVALPFARGTERALGTRLSTRGSSPERQGFPAPAAAALDILTQGLRLPRTESLEAGCRRQFAVVFERVLRLTLEARKLTRRVLEARRASCRKQQQSRT